MDLLFVVGLVIGGVVGVFVVVVALSEKLYERDSWLLQETVIVDEVSEAWGVGQFSFTLLVLLVYSETGLNTFDYSSFRK